MLAAGRATRFGAGPGESKVLAELAGKPLVRNVAVLALASQAVTTIVVTGQAAERVAAVLADLPVALVHNPDYASGMASSLKVGIAALSPDIDGALILLADMPRVAVVTLDALIATFVATEPAPAAVAPVHAGHEGNPALLGRDLFSDVARLEGDAGARRLFAGRSIIACPVDDPGILFDIDTRDALRELEG